MVFCIGSLALNTEGKQELLEEPTSSNKKKFPIWMLDATLPPSEAGDKKVFTDSIPRVPNDDWWKKGQLGLP